MRSAFKPPIIDQLAKEVSSTRSGPVFERSERTG